MSNVLDKADVFGEKSDISSMSVDRIIGAAMIEIGKLPQSQFIGEERALRWIERTLEIDPSRLMWHIKRAGGVGGSEAGAIMDWRWGGVPARNSADKIAKQKLLILPPDRSNKDTGRGIYLENHIKSVFEEGLNGKQIKGKIGQWRECVEVKQKVESNVSDKLSWMRASLDGVYEIDGEFYIVDFKAPTEKSLDNYRRYAGFEDYVAQLNHYAIVSKRAGVVPTGAVLAMYDYAAVSEVGCEIFDVPLDIEFQRNLVRASKEFWQEYILKGKIPDVDHTVYAVPAAEIPPDIEAAARTAVVAKITLDNVTDTYESSRKKVAKWIESQGQLGERVVMMGNFNPDASEDILDKQGFMKFKAEQKLDTEKAIQRLRDLGMQEENIEELRLPSKYDSKKIVGSFNTMLALMERLQAAQNDSAEIESVLAEVNKCVKKAPLAEKGDFDPEKVIKALEFCGEVPYTFYIEEVSGVLDRSKRPDLEDRKNLVAESVGFLLDKMSHLEHQRELFIGGSKP